MANSNCCAGDNTQKDANNEISSEYRKVCKEGCTSFAQINFDVDLSIYSQEALNYTCYDYAGRFYIEQNKDYGQAQGKDEAQPSIVHITLLCKEVGEGLSEDEATRVRLEFRQSLIDYQTRIDLEKRFGHIRDLLVAEAIKPVNS